MKICDRDNSSKCGTEFMRWIQPMAVKEDG